MKPISSVKQYAIQIQLYSYYFAVLVVPHQYKALNSNATTDFQLDPKGTTNSIHLYM